MRHFAVVGFVLVIVLAGCAPAGGQSRGESSTGDGATQRPRTRLIVGSLDTDKTVSTAINGAGGTGAGSGGGTTQKLLTSGLTDLDGTGARVPRLAAQTPTIENGLWRVTPAGGMEMTWNLVDGARWHDGAPVTADDVLLTWKLEQNKEIAWFKTAATEFVDSVEVVDARTVLVRFSQVFLGADAMFGEVWPNHLLGAAYATNPENLILLPYWTHDFVGIGPYKLKEWQDGIQATVEAYDGYVRGRPKIDEIIIKFISDANTLYANLLAGTVELVYNRGISFEQSVEFAKLPEGRAGYQINNIEILFPQHLNPAVPAIADARFRRALFQALDRTELNNLITGGTAPLADNTLASPRELEYKFIAGSIVQYDFDPRRSVQIIDDMGFAKGADGKYREADGRPISLDIQATTGDINEVAQRVVADYWRKIGLEVTETAIPRARTSDNEYRYGRPGFSIAGGGNSLAATATGLHSKERPLPETRWAGRNRARYSNPEIDSLIDRYQQTLAFEPRMDLYRQVARIITDDLGNMPLFYPQRVTVWPKKLQNVNPDLPALANVYWNVTEWVLPS